MDNLTPITREEMLMNDEPLTPITREEKILAGEDLNPVTRREYFLKKYRHTGGDVMVEELSVTENGTYTAPEGKAYSPVEVAVPLPENAYLLKEASGSLVSFDDGADLPMPLFVCNIDAVQDLHGYDAPWVGGAGKNKCPQLITEFTYSANAGGSHTANDGVLAVSVTSTNNSGVYTSPSFVESYSQVCSYSMDIKADVSMNALVGFTNFGRKEVSLTNQWQRVTFDNVTFDGSTQTLVIYGRGTAGTISVKNFMFELGSVSHDYAPYSNICPISGHTGVNAVISPTTEASAGTTYSVSWQTEAGEVFGGYVDLVSGVLTVDRVSVVYEGGNDEAWTMSTGGSDDTSWHQFYTPRTSAKNSLNAICNRFPTKDIAYRGTESLLVAYTDRTFRIALKDSDLLITSVDDWKTWLSTNNVQIVYELATPITYQLTPTQIKSLLGNNNAWCSTGNVDIDYFAKEVE